MFITNKEWPKRLYLKNQLDKYIDELKLNIDGYQKLDLAYKTMQTSGTSQILAKYIDTLSPELSEGIFGVSSEEISNIPIMANDNRNKRYLQNTLGFLDGVRYGAIETLKKSFSEVLETLVEVQEETADAISKFQQGDFVDNLKLKKEKTVIPRYSASFESLNLLSQYSFFENIDSVLSESLVGDGLEDITSQINNVFGKIFPIDSLATCQLYISTENLNQGMDSNTSFPVTAGWTEETAKDFLKKFISYEEKKYRYMNSDYQNKINEVVEKIDTQDISLGERLNLGRNLLMLIRSEMEYTERMSVSLSNILEE